ncbi:hypothetical protein JNK13_03475 [bacterium]|nr:hypothetical protein [bacterium]
MFSKLIIAAAFEPEIEALRATMSSDRRFEFLVCGVGSIEAAAKTAQYLTISSESNRAVIFVGSLGSSTRDLPINSLVSASTVRLATVEDNSSYLVPTMKSDFAADIKISNIFPESQIHSLAVRSTMRITQTPGLAAALAKQSDTTCENLELFGVAMACKELQVPWGSLGVVTNYCFENAHQEWKDNYRNAAGMISEFFNLNREKFFAFKAK